MVFATGEYKRVSSLKRPETLIGETSNENLINSRIL